MSGRTQSRATLRSILSDTSKDFRFTLRSLRKSPTFSVVAILVAGLGISLTTLAFTTVNASFLRPHLHVRAPEELVRLSRELPSRPGRRYRLSHSDLLQIREWSTALEDIVGVRPYLPLMLRTGSGLDRQVIGGEVTENYFQGLGIPMILGRGIVPEDAVSGSGVAVLGHATWVRQFGSSPDALGQVILVDGQRYTVVGVAPPGLGWLSGEPVESAVWIPLRPRYREDPDANVLEVAGRLQEDATLSQAQAELDVLASGLATSEPERWREDAGVVGLRAMTDRQARLDLVGGPRGVASIMIYLVFIGLIMVIACSNVASLLLNRALRRQSETAIRLALGAGRWRLIRQLLTESVLLFFVAGSLALLLLHLSTQLLAAGWGGFLPAVAEITVDARVTAFAAGVTVCCGLAFGLVPALQATRGDLAPTLKGRQTGRRSRRFGARNFFVLVQVSASMVLVAVSALLVRDLQRAASMDIGFEPGGVAVASLDLSQGGYDEEAGRQWLNTLTERLKGLPGVSRVALSDWVPLSGSRWTTRVRPEGVEPGPDESFSAVYNAVTPGYFEMVGMPLLEGREFRDSDNSDGPPVLLVNQAFVRRYWPAQEPLGKRVALGGEGPGLEVVGVVRDAVYSTIDLRNGRSEPHIWVSRAQAYHPQVRVHLQTSGPEAQLLRSMSEEIRLLDEDLPIRRLASLKTIADSALLENRAGAALFGGFSTVALFLAALGIYGVMAHAVMERRREMGIRLAVGAGPGRVLGMVLVDTLRTCALGIGIGLGLAVLVGMGIRALLIGVSVLDPFSLTGSVLVLTLAAVSAGLAPAARAASLDPVRSLKSE